MRLLIVWVLLTIVVRFMGKRQIGEMEMSEFITAFMLSELAALPVADSGIPLLYSVIPILLLAVFEILTSSAVMHSRFLQKLVSGTPAVLIRNGIPDQRAMKSCRMTIPELMGELRQKGYPDPFSIAYAILEENGKMSVIPKNAEVPPTAKDLSKNVKETGICHTLISDGEISYSGLSMSGRTEQDLQEILENSGIRDIKQVFLLTADDAGTFHLIRKDRMNKKQGKNK